MQIIQDIINTKKSSSSQRSLSSSAACAIRMNKATLDALIAEMPPMPDDFPLFSSHCP